MQGLGLGLGELGLGKFCFYGIKVSSFGSHTVSGLGMRVQG